MENRLAALRKGAQPSGGDPAASAADDPAHAADGSRNFEATTGPAMNPPSRGAPTSPAAPADPPSIRRRDPRTSVGVMLLDPMGRVT